MKPFTFTIWKSVNEDFRRVKLGGEELDKVHIKADLVKVTPRDLGFAKRAIRLERILRRAQELGLRLGYGDLGRSLPVVYEDAPVGKKVTMFLVPDMPDDSDGRVYPLPYFFFYGQACQRYETFGTKDDFFFCDQELVFVLPQKGEETTGLPTEGLEFLAKGGSRIFRGHCDENPWDKNTSLPGLRRNKSFWLRHLRMLSKQRSDKMLHRIRLLEPSYREALIQRIREEVKKTWPDASEDRIEETARRWMRSRIYDPLS